MRDTGTTKPIPGANRYSARNSHAAPYVYGDPNPDPVTHHYAHAYQDKHPGTIGHPDTASSHGHASAADGHQHAPTGAAHRDLYPGTATSAYGHRYAPYRLFGTYWRYYESGSV